MCDGHLKYDRYKLYDNEQWTLQFFELEPLLKILFSNSNNNSYLDRFSVL
jgi:hypothetical protein